MDLAPLPRAAVRELDRRAVEEVGIPALLLMENAGRAAADEAQGLLAGGTALVLCGPGNNGGDGLVIARTLWNRGIQVRAVFFADEDRLERCSAEVRTNARLWRALGRDLELVPPEFGVAYLDTALAQAGLVVDALFGTGLTRELRDPWSGIVRRVNRAALPVLAVDLPSGLDADSGQVLGAAIRAQVTVTFVAPKLGFTRNAGPEHCGETKLAEIGIPSWLLRPV